MRNKHFAIIGTVIFLAFFVGAPLFLFLTRAGVLPYENVGNQITAEKEYEEDHPLYGLLTAIEEAKVAVKDTYVNYLPGFLNITNVFKPFKAAVDRPVIDFLAARGRELMGNVCRHAYTEERIAPTCTEGGYTLLTCSLCGDTVKKDALAAKGHTFGEAGRPQTADCEREGYTPVSCRDCSYTVLEDLSSSIGHSYTLITSTEPDCTSEGSRVFQCSRCENVVSLTIPKTHRYLPQADGEGNLFYTCADCGNKGAPVTANETSDHRHKETSSRIDGGCDSVSYMRHTCSLCGNVRIDDEEPPTGHSYAAEVFAPTCVDEGYTRLSCSRCGGTKTVDHVSARGHSYLKETVPPTVDREGYDLFTCEHCSDSFKTNFVSYVIEGIDPPQTVEDPEGTKYSASLVSKSAMFRIYRLVANYPDGTMDESYVRVIAHDRDGLYQNMLEMSDMIEEMIEVSPEVNWYFAFATNLEATELCDEFFPEESVRYIYKEFLRRLPAEAQATDVAVNSFRDYANKFYMTDHHWNHVGVSEAYYRILSMLLENYDDIAPMPLDSLYVFEDVKFYGSLARSNASYDLYDQFGLYYYDLPPHTLTIDPAIAYGSKATLPENVSRYLAGQYVTTKGYNHYTEFYRVPMKIEYPENNTGRRLLIIGDSYSLPLLELVAASFDVTYVRYEDRGWNALPDNLYIDEFVEENGITDILVIEDIVKSIMKGYGTHYPSGFLNIYPSLEYTPYKKED